MSYVEENTLNETKQRLNQTLNVVKTRPRRFAPNNGPLQNIQYELKITPHQLPLTGFNEYVDKAFGWIPLNPNDIERVRAMVSAYYLPGYKKFDPAISTLECPHPISIEYGKIRDPDQYSNKIPTCKGMLTLFECVTRPSSHLITISGRRGSGKTMVLNFFLTTAHQQLMQKGVLWFRTDIAKLWAVDEDPMTVTQYTIFHSIYIALKYSDLDKNLFPMRRIIAPDKPDERYKKGEPGKLFRDYLNEVRSFHLLNLWDDLVTQYERVERVFVNKKPVAAFLDKGNALIKIHGAGAIKEIYAEMIAFLRKMAAVDGRKLEILIILDGVDNIRVGAHQDRYFELLKEINRMLIADAASVGDRYILIARPETLQDFYYIRTMMTLGSNSPSNFDIDSDFVTDLVIRKKAAIENPTEYFQTSALEIIGAETVKKDIDCLAWSIDFLLEHLKRADVNQQPSINGTPNQTEKCNPVDLIFDGNIRSMLRNCIRAHSHKKRLKSVVPQRSLLEGSVLAGCNSMTPNLDDNVRGRWCPNLFENAEIQDGQWTGLVMVRLVQLLGAVREGITYEEAVEFLNSKFGYRIGLVHIVFQTALEYSLVRAIGFKVDDIDPEVARPKKHLLFATTSKGKYILKLAFEDYAVFYFMAVATPLDLDRVRSKGVDLNLLIHDEKDDHRHFFRAAILSGMILWTHVNTADRQERDKLDQNLTFKNVKLGQTFQIDGINAWALLAEKLLQGIKRNELQTVAETLEKYTAS